MDRKILIVDDEAHIRMLLEETLEDLEDQGVELYTAANGREAMETIKAERPDLVLLDVMMPEVNGYDVCRFVKGDPDLENTYVILLTAKGQLQDIDMGESCGADEYLTKPFNPDDIVRKASRILGLG